MERTGEADGGGVCAVNLAGDKLGRVEGEGGSPDKGLAPAEVVAPPAAKAAPGEPALKPPVMSTPSNNPATTTEKGTPAAKPSGLSPNPVDTDAPRSDAVSTEVPKASLDGAGAAKADGSKNDAPKSDAAATDEKKETPKRGMFGRMLDKIGL